MELTFDNNALIDLATDFQPHAEYLKEIRDTYHKPGLVTISIGRITFLEKMPKNSTETEVAFFKRKITDAGLNIECVQQERSGVSIPFHCLACGATTFGVNFDIAYKNQLFRIITGEKEIDASWYDFRQRMIDEPEEKVTRKWHNHINDVLGLVDHVAWGGDIFVTRDNDFLKKRDQLAKVVPGKILTPQETLEELKKTTPLPKIALAWQPRLSIPMCMSCQFKHQEK